MRPGETWEEDQARRKRLFLESFANNGIIRVACLAADINRSTAMDWKRNDPLFAEGWREAQEDAADNLEALALSRARNAMAIGSTSLLVLLLKGLRPWKYSERFITRELAPYRDMSDDELDSYIAGQLALPAPPAEDGAGPPSDPEPQG